MALIIGLLCDFQTLCKVVRQDLSIGYSFEDFFPAKESFMFVVLKAAESMNQGMEASPD